MFKKQVCLIVFIAENDWYGFIQNFDFPRGVFLPFQIVGEKPRRVFWKIQIDFFELLFITMHNKRYIKNFQHYIVPLEEKENSPAGFFPRGVFPPQNKMGEKPCGVFYPKIIFLAQRSILHSVFKVVRVLYQNSEIFQFLPWWEILKYTLPKWQCIIVRLMAENVLLPAKEFCRHIVS